MCDGAESSCIMETDGAAPRTPPLLPPHRRSPSGVTPFVRHRKTSSGFLDFDIEQLTHFPVEALPPDVEIDLDLPHHLPRTLLDADSASVNVENGADPYPSWESIQKPSAIEADFLEGADAIEGGSVSWPKTPSCKCLQNI